MSNLLSGIYERRLVSAGLLAGLLLGLGACSFVLSEDEEYRYRTIDYPVGKKQKLK